MERKRLSVLRKPIGRDRNRSSSSHQQQRAEIVRDMLSISDLALDAPPLLPDLPWPIQESDAAAVDPHSEVRDLYDIRSLGSLMLSQYTYYLLHHVLRIDFAYR
jgi:hypothetical protein